jgi:hypothetical protein
MIGVEILGSDDLKDATMRVRLGFVAMILHLDDYGRCAYDPDLIRAHAWPRDRVSTKQMIEDLDDMVQRTLLCRYTAGQRQYLHSPSWSKWQKVSHPTESRIPECPRGDSHSASEELANDSGNAPETFVPNVVEVSLDIDQINVVQAKADEPPERTWWNDLQDEIEAHYGYPYPMKDLVETVRLVRQTIPDETKVKNPHRYVMAAVKADPDRFKLHRAPVYDIGRAR